MTEPINRYVVVMGEDTKNPASESNALPVSTQNVDSKFRDAFETYEPNQLYYESKNNGDLIFVDGNAAAASYLVISKSPWNVGESRIESIKSFQPPFELSAGVHASQRVVGQEFSMEVVSNEPGLTAIEDKAIASIQQAASVLTVTTAQPHGLKIGSRIGINGCSDSRLNYQALVVASTPSATQFTATAGPNGTIPSLTAGPFASGVVFSRSALGYAKDGTSIIWENDTITNASFYIRSNSGDNLPSGTIAGSHSTTISTLASIQAINAAYHYAFQPSSEFKLRQFVDHVQWTDVGVDAITAENNRVKRTQVVPAHEKNYIFRIRATNNASFTRPVAKITSVVKTGTTTATVTTETPHGLTSTDLVNIYGLRDQVAFANVTAATAITVTGANTFTIVFGTAVTATTFGGYVSKVNGGKTQGGAITQVVQQAALSNDVLTLTGNAAWSGFLIGDLVELVNIDTDTGVSLGLDGAWRVRNISTTLVELENVDGLTLPANFTTINACGALIKRTDLRVSFVRIIDFDRQRVEMTQRPQADLSNANPVILSGTPAVSISGTATVSVSGNPAVVGQVAEDAAAGTSPVLVGGVARTTNSPTTIVNGDVIRSTMTLEGATVQKPYAVNELEWATSLSLTTTTPAAIRAAQAAGLKSLMTSFWAINTGAAAVDLIILDGATERLRYTLPINVPVHVQFPTCFVVTAATALNANLSAAGTVRLNALGYTSK